MAKRKASARGGKQSPAPAEKKIHILPTAIVAPTGTCGAFCSRVTRDGHGWIICYESHCCVRMHEHSGMHRCECGLEW